MNVRPIRVTTEERVSISSIITDVSVQLAILERNVRPVSSFCLFVRGFSFWFNKFLSFWDGFIGSTNT